MPTPWRQGKRSGSLIGAGLWSGNFHHYPQRLETARFLGERGAGFCVCVMLWVLEGSGSNSSSFGSTVQQFQVSVM